MSLPDNISSELNEALRNERFRRAAELLADTYIAAVQKESEVVRPDTDDRADNKVGLLPWATLRQEHFLTLLERLARHAERGKGLEYEDIGDDLNPLRNLWSLCFRQFAGNDVLATNHVSPSWTTSAQQDSRNLGIQRDARGRGVAIQRIYILDEQLPAQILHELRYAVIRQLNAGISLFVIRPTQVDSYVDTGRLQTKDFIIFDNSLVYATVVDREEDQRHRRNTYVRLYDDPDMVRYARKAWSDMMDRADSLSTETLHKYVDPYGADGAI